MRIIAVVGKYNNDFERTSASKTADLSDHNRELPSYCLC